MNILVAYASKHGSTHEVAERVASELAGAPSTAVDVRPAADIRVVDDYDAVVLGGALYMGRLHADARRFLRRHRNTLASRPLAVFAMGPQTSGDADLEGSRRQLDRALARVPELEPLSVAIFGGVLRPSELHFPFNRMDPVDARDWETIHDWATTVRDSLVP
jgi:menaquinone-dependent protoporphyrinogen oxidase